MLPNHAALLALFFLASTIRAFDFANLRPLQEERLRDVVAAANLMPLRKRQNFDPAEMYFDQAEGQEPADSLQAHALPVQSRSTRSIIPYFLADSVLQHALYSHHLHRHQESGQARLPAHSASNSSFPLPASARPSHQPVDTSGEDYASTKQALLPHEAIQYNVSSLQSFDPLDNRTTSLDYDYDVRIDDRHHIGEEQVSDKEGIAPKNAKGSMETRLNGTIAGLGSIGSVISVGWQGRSNKPSVPANNTTRNAPPIQGTDQAMDESKSDFDPHPPASSDGLSGVWVAFSSSDAVTGGYMMRADQATTSNNVVFANVTVRTNVTIDAQGRLSVAVVIGEVESEGKGKGPGSSGNTTHASTKVKERTKTIQCTQSTREREVYGSQASHTIRCHKRVDVHSSV